MTEQVKAKFELIETGSLTDNLNALKKFVQNSELKPDQIISFNVHETATDQGDSSVAILYRSTSQDIGATPIIFDFLNFNLTKSWQEQETLAMQEFAKRDKLCLGLERSPKSVGKKQNQVMFFRPCVNADENYVTETLTREDGNWEALCVDITQWMETHVAPH